TDGILDFLPKRLAKGGADEDARQQKCQRRGGPAVEAVELREEGVENNQRCRDTGDGAERPNLLGFEEAGEFDRRQGQDGQEEQEQADPLDAGEFLKPPVEPENAQQPAEQEGTEGES